MEYILIGIIALVVFTILLLIIKVEKLRNRVKEVKSLTRYSLYKKEFARLNKQLEKKDTVIDLLADDLRYYEGMQQDQLFCIDTCEGKMCDEEHCKERIKEYFYKKVE